MATISILFPFEVTQKMPEKPRLVDNNKHIQYYLSTNMKVFLKRANEVSCREDNVKWAVEVKQKDCSGNGLLFIYCNEALYFKITTLLQEKCTFLCCTTLQRLVMFTNEVLVNNATLAIVTYI